MCLEYAVTSVVAFRKSSASVLGHLASFAFAAVKTSTPVSVTSKVCSTCMLH